MSLRLRLILALTFIAVVAMSIALVIPLWRAERRANAEADARLNEASRRARLMVERRVAEASSRFERMLGAISSEEAIRDHLLRGPAQPAAQDLTRLAARFSFERASVQDAAGNTLAQVEPESERNSPIELTTTLSLAGERLRVSAGDRISSELTEAIAQLAEGSAVLITDTGDELHRTGPDPDRARRAQIGIGEAGWRVQLAIAGGDVAQIRRETLTSFLATLPIALAGAFLVGLVLAYTISKPVRALTERVEAIARERAKPLLIPDDRNEVRRLQTAIEQLLVALDTSELQRREAERIAAWEDVAKRIAHEVKNPLSPIKLAVENLQRTRIKAPEAFDRALAEESATILEEVESLRRLVDEFSEFARLPRPTFQPVWPAELVRKAVSLFKPRIERCQVRVQFEIADEQLSIEADAEQLGRVLKNVIANALDAMEPVDQRTLKISVRPQRSVEPELLSIQIQDSGVGVTAELARRAFEPYFTTKHGRGGTGLGMAIAARIIAEHGGTIQIEGAPERGAMVTIVLPFKRS